MLRIALSLAALLLSANSYSSDFIETPNLQAEVDQQQLPPVNKRLPQKPAIVELAENAGQHGGSINTLMGRAKDIRLMMVYGYARLIAYNPQLDLEPDILEKIEVVNDREFTLYIRPGHKWSDGAPFTAEDFRYYWEDVANNQDLAPYGPPRSLRAGDALPQFEVLNETTVRYRWATPNPRFLPALAAARPLFIYRPAHYLKQFHINYTHPEKIAQMVTATNTRNWAGLHHRHDHQYKFDNPELPTLQPWRNTTRPPAERFIFKRNPFFHRVDQNGRQLPYLDKIFINIADKKLIPAKTGAGEVDLQTAYLRFDNYTFLKAAADRHNYEVYLWKKGIGAQVAIFPNLNAKDPVWRRLLQNSQFRQALSLAIDRHEINHVVYYGLGLKSNNTVLPKSPLHRLKYQKRWTQFDLEHANRLLDGLGLTERNNRGLRLLSDGRPMEIIVDTAGESTEQTDVLELVHDSWLKAGIKLYTRPSQREVFRSRVFSGESIMSIWFGIENAVATANMSPSELAPTEQIQLQWPQWGHHYESGGQAGQAPTLPVVRQLLGLYENWANAASFKERAENWEKMLDIHSEHVFSIGIVAGSRQPVVVHKTLRNVPVDGFYSWSPGAYLGVYRPDTFWLDQSE